MREASKTSPNKAVARVLARSGTSGAVRDPVIVLEHRAPMHQAPSGIPKPRAARVDVRIAGHLLHHQLAQPDSMDTR